MKYLILAVLFSVSNFPLAFAEGSKLKAPVFKVAPAWPQDLPENLILGQVSGIAHGKNDTIWILHRPRSLMDDEKGATKNPPETRCCKAAPPVLQFSKEGKLLKSWGGTNGEGYTWPENEHGLHIDTEGNVWLGGNNKDDQILKFTQDGKFLLQVGKVDATPPSSSNTARLNRPAHMVTDEAAGELYVADGYGNRRIIVFDMKTGAYKRHWGAYGKPPHDEKLPPYKPVAFTNQSSSFSNPVHCVRLSNDGFVYVCDRANDRIQVFQKNGTFVREYQVEPQTMQNGSVWDLVLSEDKAQKYIFVADGANMQVVAIDRQTGTKLSSFGRPGRMAGNLKWVHNIAIDTRGNIFTAEVGDGRRVQKFRRIN